MSIMLQRFKRLLAGWLTVKQNNPEAVVVKKKSERLAEPPKPVATVFSAWRWPGRSIRRPLTTFNYMPS